MLAWIREDMLAEGMISPADLELLHVTDDPDDAVQRVIESYEPHALEPGSQFAPGS
jgi:predicted Rossmann-fold nucleotide-binding protein